MNKLNVTNINTGASIEIDAEYINYIIDNGSAREIWGYGIYSNWGHVRVEESIAHLTKEANLIRLTDHVSGEMKYAINIAKVRDDVVDYGPFRSILLSRGITPVSIDVKEGRFELKRLGFQVIEIEDNLLG